MTDPERPYCRFCRGTSGAIVLDLREQPPCEVFPPVGDTAQDTPCRLRMWFCDHCRLAQLVEDPGRPEESLAVVDSVASLTQMGTALDFAAEAGVLRGGTSVLEFPSPHNGSWMPELLRRGACTAGPDGRAELVLDVFGLLHEPDQREALARRVDAMAPGGALVVQIHGLATVITHQETGELRHGHFAYWSSPALAAALSTVGLGVHRARRFDYDHGTAVLIATADPRPDAETLELLNGEVRAGVLDPEVLTGLQRSADRQAARLTDWLGTQRRAGRSVVLYGAASRAVPLLCHAGVSRSDIVAVADASVAKQGRRLPGTDIPIVAPEEMRTLHPDRVLVTVSELLAEVRATWAFVERDGGRWVTVPDVVDPVASPVS